MPSPVALPWDAIREYGATVPEHYGGMHIEGSLTVVLFTADLERHERAIRALIPDFAGLAVRRTDQTWQSVESACQSVTGILFGVERYPGLQSVGVGLNEGRFAVFVGVDPYDDLKGDEIKRTVAPHQVVVHHQRPVRLV